MNIKLLKSIIKHERPFQKLKERASKINWELGLTEDQKVLKMGDEWIEHIEKKYNADLNDMALAMNDIFKTAATQQEIRLKTLITCRYAKEHKMTIPVAYLTIKKNNLWPILLK